jgi:BNR repeat-like domain
MKRVGLIIAVFGFFLFAQTAQAQWTTAKRLTSSPDYSGTPAIALDPSGTIHVVYEDATPGNAEIYYTRSKDGGVTWSTPRRLTWTLGDSYWATIATDSSGGIHVAWEDFTPEHNAIYYKKSTDGGRTWTTSRCLTSTLGNSYNSAIAVDSSDYLHLVWNDDTPANLEIYYKKSTDRGVTWSAGKRLTWNSGDSGWPAIAVDSVNNLHVSWMDQTPGNDEIFYKKSTDRGVTWAAATRLTWTSPGLNIYVEMAVDPSDNLHLVWHGRRPTPSQEIYYRKSTDKGTTWMSIQRLTWTSGWSDYPDIATDAAGSLHVVWFDDTPGQAEIYYKMSTDGGVTWTAGKRLTSNAGNSNAPALAAESSGNLHVVWMDDTDGNWEIYYKKFNK